MNRSDQNAVMENPLAADIPAKPVLADAMIADARKISREYGQWVVLCERNGEWQMKVMGDQTMAGIEVAHVFSREWNVTAYWKGGRVEL